MQRRTKARAPALRIIAAGQSVPAVTMPKAPGTLRLATPTAKTSSARAVGTGSHSGTTNEAEIITVIQTALAGPLRAEVAAIAAEVFAEEQQRQTAAQQQAGSYQRQGGF